MTFAKLFSLLPSASETSERPVQIDPLDDIALSFSGYATSGSGLSLESINTRFLLLNRIQ